MHYLKTLFKITIVSLSINSLAISNTANPGPYPPAAGVSGSTAIHKDDPTFTSWASGYRDYIEGAELEQEWKTPEKALGPANGTIGDVVSLGKGGQITLIFEPPIANGPGFDFAVFENAFSDGFLELAFVEVSSDGQNFTRFPNHSLTPEPVGAFNYNMDPTLIDGLAGKYRLGYGAPFDLADLPETPDLDRNAIRYVRIIDIIGDGNTLDSYGNPIYDPYPTQGSAGFDLDAIGAINIQTPSVPELKNKYISGSQLFMEFEYLENENFEARLYQSSDFNQWETVDIELDGYKIQKSTVNGVTLLKAEVPLFPSRYFQLRRVLR